MGVFVAEVELEAGAAAEAAQQEMLIAAWKRSEAVDNFLAEHKFKGINIGKRSLTKTTYPLHEASKRNNIDMVRMLVEERANLEQTNSRKQTPLQRAIRQNKNGSHTDVIALIKGLSTEWQANLGGA